MTLREAVLAAESDGTTDLGETGSGADTIVFDPSLVATGDATIVLGTVGDGQFGPSALLITTPVTIQGPSGGRGITLERDGAVPKLRHFAVTASGSLTLLNLTLAAGRVIGGDGGTNAGDDGGGGGGGAGLGGAIYSQGVLRISASTLTGNRAIGGSGGPGADNAGNDSGGGGGGGGLGGDGGSVPDDGSDGGGGFGGAIFNQQGSVTLQNTTFSGNVAQGGLGGGGGFPGTDGEGLGGALFNLNGTVSIENGTFAGNTAGRGIDLFNLAHETAGGITPADATLTLTNTILASSALETVENAQVGADPGTATLEADDSDILLGPVNNNGGTFNDGGVMLTDPLLGPLQDNGGPTPTRAPQFPGSPAIDASTAGAPTDQRGVDRPQGAGFDIGAVEVPQFTGALAPGDLLLTEWGGGSVVDIQGGGDFTLAPRFAYGLDAPFGICRGPGSEVYVAEFNTGEVSVITTGGDFPSAPPFATGLSLPVKLLCTDTQILVSEYGSGEVTDVTAGGDFTGAPAFATGLGSVVGLARDSNGTLWAADQNGRVLDITAGGDFTADPGFANMGVDLRGVAEHGTTLLVSSTGNATVLDFSAGGALTMAPVFAMGPALNELVDLGPLGLFATSDGGLVYEISAGGDFTTAEPFATGVRLAGGFAGIALIPGCGDGILDPAVEECDDGNQLEGDGCSATCEIRCAPAPLASCVAAAKGSLGLDERKPGKEKLKASLKKFGSDVIQADFGDPVGGATRFAACLYDGSDTLALDLRVDRAGALCGPKQKPCWKALSTKGYAYKDPLAEAEGVAKITAKGGSAGKGSLTVEGRNKAKKGLTQLPTGAAAALQGATSATLQVLASDGACFSVPLTTVKKADGAQFKAKAP